MTVQAAVEVLNAHNVGAVLVMSGTGLVGIFTERDVLRRVLGAHRDPRETRVEEVMTPNVVTVTPRSNLRPFSPSRQERDAGSGTGRVRSGMRLRA